MGIRNWSTRKEGHSVDLEISGWRSLRSALDSSYSCSDDEGKSTPSVLVVSVTSVSGNIPVLLFVVRSA